MIGKRVKRLKAATEEERLERRRAQARAWKARNRDKVREDRSRYYQEHKQQERENTSSWLERNPSKKLEYRTVYRRKHREELILKQASESWKKKRRVRQNDRYKIDATFRLRINASASMRHALKFYGDYAAGSKGGSCLDLLGCTIDELVHHLQEQFQSGMTWENYGKFGWHVDHMRPCASFDLSIPEQIKECFHFTNLQPLWWRDNIVKGDRWEPEATKTQTRSNR